MRRVSDSELTILYGSQSGNAEFLAYNVSEAASNAGINAELMSLDDALQAGNVSWQRLLIVTSTHDNGHMPENAAGFWSWLQTCEPSQYAGLPYAVLAIGDSMYEDFCKAGHDFDQEFERLGAVKIVESIDCDVDYDMTSTPWIKKFLSTVPEVEAWSPSSSVEVDAAAVEQFASAPEQWHTATIAAQRELSGQGSEKRVLHYELELEDGFEYLPGDSVDIMPRNDEQLVAEWLNAFPGVESVELSGATVPLREALSDRLELRIPHVGLVNALLARIPSSEPADRIRNLLESGDRQELDGWLWGRDVLAVVSELGFVGSDIQLIVDAMRPLQHRSYSIASSPSVAKSRLSLTVSSVRYEHEHRTHVGCGTGFLERSVHEPILVRRAAANSFRLPENNAPVIMIGPGVGVAPFRAFLQEVESRDDRNETWLFFGDRHRSSDWLYEDEMSAWQKSGVLTRLSLAFSRDQAHKHYVQDEIRAHADALRDWVERGAHLYICGDKNHMAHDVEQALSEVLSSATLNSLREAGRYEKDVY